MLAPLLLALAASASAHSSQLHKRAVSHQPRCSLANATLALPTEGDVEVTPGATPLYLALAMGNAAYSCNSSSQWESTGLTATLYDASCSYNATSMSFATLTAQAVLLNGTSGSLLGNTLSTLVGSSLPVLGKLETVSGAPLLDFRTGAGGNYPANSKQGFVQLSIDATQASSLPALNLPWSKSVAVKGGLASEVFAVDTAGGVPETLVCASGESQEVPFSAQVWLFGETDLVAVKSEKCVKAKTKTTKPSRKLVVLTTTVMYGEIDQTCTSVADCSAKCMADSSCVGFDLSTEDGKGITKTYVGNAAIIYSPYFTAGIVREFTNKQYVTPQGTVADCPKGQITSGTYLGCVVPPACS